MSYVEVATLTESAKIIRTGRAGKVVNRTQHGTIGLMFELAFEDQIHTECYWDTEIELMNTQTDTTAPLTDTERAEIAEFLGFDSVEAMDRHTEWLDEQKRTRELERLAGERGIYQYQIGDLRGEVAAPEHWIDAPGCQSVDDAVRVALATVKRDQLPLTIWVAPPKPRHANGLPMMCHRMHVTLDK